MYQNRLIPEVLGQRIPLYQQAHVSIKPELIEMFNPEDVMIEQKSKVCASGSLLVCKVLKTASRLNEITPSLKR